MTDEKHYRHKQAISKVLPLIMLMFVVSFGAIAAIVFVVAYNISQLKPANHEADSPSVTQASPNSNSPILDNTGPRTVDGSIYYVDAEGEKPDANCVVILLPHDSRLTIDEKVPAEKFAPNERPSNDLLERINALGGAYSRTDSDGNFRLQVPRRGRYFMLLISDNGPPISPSDWKHENVMEMGRFFTRATDLIDSRSFRWTSEQVRSDMTVNFTFDES